MHKFINFIIYWAIVAIPFSWVLGLAPMNIFLGLLGIAFVIKRIIKRQLVLPRSCLNRPLGAFLAITCISLVNSINYADTLKGGILRLIYYLILFFIIIEELRDTGHVRKILFSMTLGVVFASCDALWQVFTGKDWVRGYAPVVFIGLVRARASFKDPGTFGVYLSAVSPLVFGLSLYYFQKKKKIIMAILSLVTLIGLVLPYSRPTLLAVYLALFFLSVIKKDKILVTILIILVLISPFLLPASVKKWARQVDYNPIRFMLNDDRIAIYQHSLNMIKEHPLIGLGANTYMKNYKKYKTYPEYRNVITSDFLYAHNNFLHMGAEIGLVGLTVFIWLLYTLFSGIRNIYKNLEDNYLKVCLLSLSACLLAFLVNGLAESSLYSARVAMIFWYLSGLSLAFKKFVYNADRP